MTKGQFAADGLHHRFVEQSHAGCDVAAGCQHAAADGEAPGGQIEIVLGVADFVREGGLCNGVIEIAREPGPHRRRYGDVAAFNRVWCFGDMSVRPVQPAACQRRLVQLEVAVEQLPRRARRTFVIGRIAVACVGTLASSDGFTRTAQPEGGIGKLLQLIGS